MSSDLIPTNRPLRLGKYEVLAHLATGGMGAVYKARDPDRDRVIALKVLNPELAKSDVPLKRFYREARAAAQLDHPNIVAVYELGKRSGTHYIAMEYVDGTDLYRYVQEKGSLPIDEVLDILVQAARALEHAHERGIVHRDIKPSNFLFTRRYGSRQVKLTDFGLALDRMSFDESRLTRAGTTLGTVDYMAPEQCRGGQNVDIRSDIYALGCTAYFMLTAQVPFAGGSVPEKLYRHVHHFPRDPRELNPKVGDELVMLLGKMLQKHPEDRFQTPTELRTEVERLEQVVASRRAAARDHVLHDTPPDGIALSIADTAPPLARFADTPPEPELVVEHAAEKTSTFDLSPRVLMGILVGGAALVVVLLFLFYLWWTS